MVPKLRRGQLYEAASETQPEVKSFWPGLRTGRGGGCASKDQRPAEPGADLAHEMKADTAAGTEVFEANTFTEQISLTVSKSRQTKNHNASVGNLDEWQQLHFSWERIWVLTQIFKKYMKTEESNCWTI